MNSMNEIGLQNQQDFWAQMYLCIANSILKYCGRGGEYAIREAIHRMAVQKGETLRRECQTMKIKTNLKTLYAFNSECSEDKRVRKSVLREGEDIRLWEVYTCPMADLWMDASAGALGNFYCEENQHGLVEGFTGGKGQINLTKKLTCHRKNGCRPDNHCRFSAYYREANTTGEQRSQSFSANGEEPGQLPARGDFRRNLKETCILTLCFLTETAEEQFGTEGRSAIAAGLRDLAEITGPLLIHQADARLCKCDSAFLMENLPVELDIKKDPLWDMGKERSISRLFEVNFLEPLKKGLSLHVSELAKG